MFICPRCTRSLHALDQDLWTASEDPIRCEGCDVAYPRVLGIPVLLEDPIRALDSWARRLADFVQQVDQATKHLLVDLVDEDLAEPARARLTAVAHGLPKHKESIVRIFAEADIHPSAPSIEASDRNDGTNFSAARGAPPEVACDDSLLTYSTLIHRDFGWPPDVDEVTPAVERVVALMPEGAALCATLVLGAGTARHAWKLAEALNSSNPVVAIDVNPLPFLVTQKLLRGDEVEAWELPAHPRRASDACVERKLRAPHPAPAGLRLLFADGLAPPVAPNSFDTVITPWFVDQVPADAKTLLPTIANVLREGGTWINQGPFVYDPQRTRPAHRYLADEFLHLVAQAGFSIEGATYEPFPHLASPLSTQGRTEHVLTMRATKRASAA